ncbi:MAG: hypothetical protein HA495_00370 [Thaumarchaeota archaeon]|nr:hypothetical protein [Nitrososphaerota archaeon]
MEEERLYKPKGFTDQIIRILEKYKSNRYSWTRCLFFERVSSEDLLEISRYLPDENFDNERQNNSPRFQDFVEVAQREPRARFDLYVVTKEREDERVTVETVYIPKEREDLIKFLKEMALAEPDGEGVIQEDYYMWWD